MLQSDATRALLSQRSLEGNAVSVTVFNGVSTDRTDVVRAHLVPGEVWWGS